MVFGRRFPLVLHPILLPAVDELRHAIKVNQQAQKNLVCGRAVLVDAGEVAEDGDAGHVLAVEGQDAGGLRAQVRRTVGGRNVAMELFMVKIIRGCDLGEQASDHLDDVRDRHAADLELPLLGPMLGLGGKEDVITSEALDMGQALDADAARRIGLGATERCHRSECRLQTWRVRRCLRMGARGAHSVGCGMVAKVGSVVGGGIRGVGIGRGGHGRRVRVGSVGIDVGGDIRRGQPRRPYGWRGAGGGGRRRRARSGSGS